MIRILPVALLIVMLFPHTPASAHAQPICGGLAPTIVGTEGDDFLVGTMGPDVIYGGGGDDIIRGLGGDDVICGGPGRDRIHAGWGDDVILGGRGIDRLRGGNGDDTIDSGPRPDHIWGGRGNDRCEGTFHLRSCEERPAMIRPLDAEVEGYYGWRYHPIYHRWMMHNGWDFDAACGTPIVSPAPGKVTFSGWMDDRTGNAIRVDHRNGLMSSYAHLEGVRPRVGRYVDAGEVIGWVGTTGASTGCHLHFGLRDGGEWTDPTPFLCPAVGAPSVRWDRDGCPDR